MMKIRSILLCFLLLAGNNRAPAQPSGKAMKKDPGALAIGYNDVNAGQNLTLTFHKHIKNGWSGYAGIKCFLDNPYIKKSPANYTTFFKEFYAKNFRYRLGLKLGLEKNLTACNEYTSLFAFYDFQFTTGNIDNFAIYWGNGNNSSYIEYYDLPINVFENTIGLGAAVRLAPQLQLKLQAGLGLNFFGWRQSDNVNNYKNNLGDEWTLNRMIALSLAYNLGKPNAATTYSRKKPGPYRLQKENALAIAYDDLQTGRTLNLSYYRGLSPALRIYGGLKLHINSKAYYDYTRMQESFYFKQFSASGLQHIGLKFGAEYIYLLPKSKIKLFAFYDGQLLRSDVKNLAGLDNFFTGLSKSRSEGINLNAIWPGSVIPYGVFRPLISTRTYGPVLAWENYIGLGSKVPVGPKMQFRIQTGIGYNFYSGPKKYQPYIIDRWAIVDHYENVPWTAKRSELSRMFSIGLEYKLGRKL